MTWLLDCEVGAPAFTHREQSHADERPIDEDLGPWSADQLDRSRQLAHLRCARAFDVCLTLESHTPSALEALNSLSAPDYSCGRLREL